jgi:hypothetical protein
MNPHDVTGFIRAQLALDSTQWNLGTFGAIAAFAGWLRCGPAA